MTDEQVENWRKVLCVTIGPYALIMPKEQIIDMRDKLQSEADKLVEDLDVTKEV